MPENIPLKPVHCISCGKIIAEATITVGRLEIDCQHCGVTNKIEAVHKPEGRVKVIVDSSYQGRSWSQRNART